MELDHQQAPAHPAHDPAQLPRPGTLAEAGEMMMAADWHELVAMEADFAVGRLTPLGNRVMLPLVRALGVEGELPLNGLVLMRLYRRALSLAFMIYDQSDPQAALERARRPDDPAALV